MQEEIMKIDKENNGVNKPQEEKSLVDTKLKEIGVSREEATMIFQATSQLANKIVDYNMEREKTIQIIAQEQRAITEIQEKYGTIRDTFTKIFGERRAVIDKNFEVIDKGLRENDYTLISMGLNQLSNVVTTSPFADLVSFQNILESDDEDDVIYI